ncbi:MAG: hypothetical protein ACP5D3_01060 [Sulfurovum sp.]
MYNKESNKKSYKEPQLKKIGLVAQLTKKDGSSSTLDAGNSPHRAVS